MMENTIVSTTEVHKSMVVELPRIFSAPFRSPAPNRMEARGAPPWPAKAAKADTSMMMGNVMPRPVRAVLPTSGMCPM